jgi:Ca-activated chloride channel family protein
MNDSNAPPGKSTPSNPPSPTPGDMEPGEAAPVTAAIPPKVESTAPPNVTARPPGLRRSNPPGIPTPPPPLPGTASKLPNAPQPGALAPNASPPGSPPPLTQQQQQQQQQHQQQHPQHAAHPGEQPPPQGGPFRVQDPPANAPPHAPKMRIPLRTILFTAAAVVATALVVIFLVFRPTAPRKARSIGARLDLAAGDVTVNDATGDVKALSGTPLGAGASVSTAKGARALVRTGEGAALFLRGETSLKLLERGVDVAQGEVFLEAPRVDGDSLECTVGSYRVSASDAGVSIKRDGKDITVYVARGLAILTSPGGRVEITAGEQATAKAEGKPAVTPVAFWQDWTGGMGDQHGSRSVGSGTGRLYGLDPAAPTGAPARKLGIAKQVVHAVLRDGVAETEVDQTFSNPGSQPIEGWYWFTIPTTAMVTGFALETNGQLVEGEVIEKREAAAQYGVAMHQGNDPALLEWVDGRTYRARVFPIPASGTRRVVLRYIEMLPMVEGKTRYVYPLRSDDPVRFDEFALSVDVGGTDQDVDVSSSLDARVEPGGRIVSMRRSGYVPRADFQLELASKKKRPPVSAWRFQAGADQADYVMLRYAPDKDFAKEPQANADVVLVVDTSAGGDESSRQLRVAAAESTLRALSDQDHFALVTLDVAPTVVYPKEGLAPATEADIAKALEKLSDHPMSGATDLGAMFEPALDRLHGKEQAAVIYVGDGAPTSGETGAEALLDRLRRSLTGSRARFFAIGTGADAHHDLLTQLTRAGGGQYVRIDESSQTTGQALRLTSAIKTAAITDIAVDLGAGLDQPLYSATGKLSRGEELVLLARTHHPLPDRVSVKGRIAGKDFEDKYDVKVDTTSVTASLVPRLWAAEYARRLMGSGTAQEDNRGQILSLGVEYGLITPFTSSLALDSEASYARQGITRKRSRVRGVRLTAIESPSDEEHLMRGLLPAAPPTMMGCSRSMSSSDNERASAASQSDGVVSESSPMTGGNAPAAPPAVVAMPVPQAMATAATSPVAVAPAARPADESANAFDDAPMRKSGNIGGGGGGANAKAAPAPRAMKPSIAAPTGPQGRSVAEPVPQDLKDRGLPSQRRDGDDASVDKKQTAEERRAEKEGRGAIPKVPAAAAFGNAYRIALVRALARCSDVAARPLSERLVIWQKRAKKAVSAQELATLYDGAYGSCELPDWRDEAALLDIVQQRIDTEQSAEIILGHFSSFPEGQRFVARNLLRRTVDVRIAAAVSRAIYGGVDWPRLDREIGDMDKTDKQLARLKQAMLVAPGDPQGDVRLVKLLARNGQKTEAVAHGRRLRDRGFLTPTLAQQLGDVLADSGDQEEALRTYSEIVEFDGQSPVSRRVLGDIFLRQGWYPAAYRQYKTLTDLDGKNPLAWLRLANAAAGAGRVDEALRIDREVAGGEGTPGPNDPRMFARLLSAARLGVLLDKPDPAAGVTTEAVSRKIKELSLFSGPGTLSILTWEDLDAQVVLGTADEKKEQLIGEATDAGAVGLYAVLSAPDSWERVSHAARYKSEILQRKVPFRLVTLVWTGKDFKVTTKKDELKPGAKQQLL